MSDTESSSLHAQLNFKTIHSQSELKDPLSIDDDDANTESKNVTAKVLINHEIKVEPCELVVKEELMETDEGVTHESC